MKSEGGIKKTLGVIGYVLACLILAVLVAISIGVLIETLNWRLYLQKESFSIGIFYWALSPSLHSFSFRISNPMSAG